jgi:hypothetical protein
MKLFNQLITVALGLMLTITTVTAYAWWNQSSTTVNHIEMMIAYGNRVTLRNLTPSNQGKLVPKGTPLSSLPGYTSEYVMTFSVDITGVFQKVELLLSVLNLHVKTKSESILPYDHTNPILEGLKVNLTSPDDSMTFLRQPAFVIKAPNTILNFQSGDLLLSNYAFNLHFELEESLITRESFQILSEATIGFDITVEVLT